MQDRANKDIAVVGGGIIGVSIALKLQSLGYDVAIYDRKGIAAEASQGNAGAFAFSEIVPLATPGILTKAPKWLLDPMGPLSIPPAYALQLAPWMLRFWRASWKDRYHASMAAQAELMSLSRQALERQIEATQGERLMQRDGQLQLFEGEKEFRASLPVWETRRAHGIRFELLSSAEEIAEIQPGLDHRFTHAGFTPDWTNTLDPKAWCQHLADRFCALGGKVELQEVTGVSLEGGKPKLRLGGAVHHPDKVVLAAGAWSHHLARQLGEKIPLETERGYNTTLPKGAFDLRTHVTFGSHGFVASRINGGVRIGGAVELGGLKRAPNYRRADVLLKKAQRFMPGLQTEGGQQWMGFRPSMPDSLPVIGCASASPSVIFAFGHGHLGLTQSAATAELVVSLITGARESQLLRAFAPQRFS
ncbi:oxidoreductase, FAD-binding protein [Roseobacter sp. SK209-2-6]|uniref:NAD(P)/FAD-dependent oxidoreductase n=1 Tax=Roseobacter sp. SK209-2-6 TaxID=388739 RepID=UPI0000F3CDFF|nr:FAD-binding oxidoreductase [Roseobacter sp. SK209-2-6]EBA15995.1 oxidoreductase, FAD-binding protein [Roseobacter sp. SK209-2-6]